MHVHATLDRPLRSEMEYLAQKDAEIRRRKEDLGRRIATVREALRR